MALIGVPMGMHIISFPTPTRHHCRTTPHTHSVTTPPSIREPTRFCRPRPRFVALRQDAAGPLALPPAALELSVRADDRALASAATALLRSPCRRARQRCCDARNTRGGAGAGGSSETPECASASNAELISALLTDVARAPGKLMTESERRRAEPPHDLKQERKNPKLRDDDGNLIDRPQ